MNNYEKPWNDITDGKIDLSSYDCPIIKEVCSLQNVKDQFYAELASDSTIVMSLEQYIREYYIPCYDAELNFIGYERK